MKPTLKPIWKMSGSHNKYEFLTRLYCYVECDKMDDAFRIARSTFGERTITTAQRLAQGEKMDNTLPYFTNRG